MRRRSFAVPLIILANIGVYFLWNYFLPPVDDASYMVQNFLVSWESLRVGRYWTALTSVFSHNSFWHIFMNMFVLNSFGPIIESGLGFWRFTRFYLAAGIFSSLCHVLVSASVLGEPGLPALGASGAVSGVVLLFSLLFPKEKILIFAVIPVPALFGALIFVGLDVWGLLAQAEGGGLPIGHGAHLGGAFAGLVYYFSIRRHLRRVHEI